MIVATANDSQGHKTPSPNASSQPATNDALLPNARSMYSTIPPEIGMAEVSSPNTAAIGKSVSAPSKKANMAASGPPPTMTQSPTIKIQPVPTIAPKPILK